MFDDSSVEQPSIITTSSQFSDVMKLVANLTSKMDQFICTSSNNDADQIEIILEQIAEFVKAERSNQTKV